MELPEVILALPKAAQDRWVALYEALSGSHEPARVRTATALVLSLAESSPDWDALPALPTATPVAEAQTYTTMPARIAAQLPEEARKIWIDTYNMCCILGLGGWECDEAAWKAIDLAGYAPDNLPKYTKVVESIDIDPAIQFREASGSSVPGSLWDVVLITSGMSKNRRRYSESTLRESAPLFNNVKSYADHDLTGKASLNRSVRDVVGWFDNAKFDESARAITARFHVLESAKWLRETLLDLSNNGVPNLIGLSINASGEQKLIKEGTGHVNDVVRITSVYSVDVVTEPAAGGSLVRLVASVDDKLQEVTVVDPKEIKRLLESGMAVADLKLIRPDLSEAIDALVAETPGLGSPKPAAAAVATLVREDVHAPATLDVAAITALFTEQTAPLQESLKAMRKRSVQNYAVAQLAESRMPTLLKEKIKTNFFSLLERREADEAEFDAMLTEQNELWAAFEQHSGSGAVRNVPGPRGTGISEGSSGMDKFLLAFDGALANKDQKDEDGKIVRRFTSFKEAFFAFTGKSPFGTSNYEIMAESIGSFDSAIHSRRFEESMSTASWPQVLSDRMYRRMMDEYRLISIEDWRKLVSNIENVPDFRSQRRERVGGYGLLETVDELETYPELTSPTDEEVSYVVQKRGGLESLSFEMVVNDDLQQIRRIPVKLARAAAQTLFRYVLDTLKDGNSGTIYDGSALFHVANHANLLTAALSDSALTAAYQAMRAQAAYNNDTEILAIRPKYLWVPPELEQLAWKLVTSDVSILGSNYNATEPNFWKNKMEVVVVDYWTDTNNWFLSADPAQVPTYELGFLNGQEDPELFVQDQPNVGSVMMADKITYKIRHIYNGVVLDYRGFHGNVVA